MVIRQLTDSFQLHYYFVIANKVCNVICIQLFTSIEYFEAFFSFKRNLLIYQLFLEGFLIYSFHQTNAEAFVDLENSAKYLAGL